MIIKDNLERNEIVYILKDELTKLVLNRTLLQKQEKQRYKDIEQIIIKYQKKKRENQNDKALHCYTQIIKNRVHLAERLEKWLEYLKERTHTSYKRKQQTDTRKEAKKISLGMIRAEIV